MMENVRHQMVNFTALAIQAGQAVRDVFAQSLRDAFGELEEGETRFGKFKESMAKMLRDMIIQFTAAAIAAFALAVAVRLAIGGVGGLGGIGDIFSTMQSGLPRESSDNVMRYNRALTLSTICCSEHVSAVSASGTQFRFREQCCKPVILHIDSDHIASCLLPTRNPQRVRVLCCCLVLSRASQFSSCLSFVPCFCFSRVKPK